LNVWISIREGKEDTSQKIESFFGRYGDEVEENGGGKMRKHQLLELRVERSD